MLRVETTNAPTGNDTSKQQQLLPCRPTPHLHPQPSPKSAAAAAPQLAAFRTRATHRTTEDERQSEWGRRQEAAGAAGEGGGCACIVVGDGTRRAADAAGCVQVVARHACLAAAVQPVRRCPVLFLPPCAACAPPLRRRCSVRHVADACGAAVCGGLRVEGPACAAVVAGRGPPL